MKLSKIFIGTGLSLCLALTAVSCGDMDDGKINSSGSVSSGGGIVSDIVSDVESITPDMSSNADVSSDMESIVSNVSNVSSLVSEITQSTDASNNESN